MTEPLLDRLDRDPGGARRFVADLLGQGATNAQVAEALASRFGASVTPRSITTWRNNDPELVAMLAELDRIRQNLSPDDDANPADLLKPAVNLAAVDLDLELYAEAHPAQAALLRRDEEGAEDRAAAETDYYGRPIESETPADDDAVPSDDALAVLSAEHDSPEAFEADALSRLTADERDEIAHLLTPA